VFIVCLGLFESIHAAVLYNIFLTLSWKGGIQEKNISKLSDNSELALKEIGCVVVDRIRLAQNRIHLRGLTNFM
jgi:hypothetical protein